MIEGKKASSSHRIKDSVWKLIWGLPVQVKIRNFMRRICRNFIATYLNLWRRKIRQSPLCPICKEYDESVEHMIL